VVIAPRRREGLALAVLFVTILLDFVGFSILIPVLPEHLRGLGADSAEVGLAVALYGFAMVLFLPLWGWMSDRFGRRPVLLSCLLGTAASFVLMALAQTLTMFYIARALTGFFGASVGTAHAYVTDVTEEHNRAHGIGLVSAAAAAGMVFGPGIGGLLHAISPLLPFYGTAGLAAAAFVAAMVLLPEPRAESRASAGWKRLAVSVIPTPIIIFFNVHSNRTRVYLYLFFHLAAAFAPLEAMFPLYAADRFAWTTLHVGLYVSYLAGVLVITQGVLIRQLARVVSESVLVIIGLGLAGPSLVLLTRVESLVGLAITGLGIAVGFGIAYPSFTSLYSKHCSTPGQAGEYMAHSYAMTQTGRGIGAYLGGLAFHHLGITSPFVLGGLGLCVALGLFALGLRFLLRRR
jgi:DHA1 family tetracycline resistance protein-like MFS transporter